jgi:hypothetical protein
MSEKSNKVENWGATWRFYWKFAGPTFRKVWWCFLLLPLIVGAALVEPSIYRLIVDELTKVSQGAAGIAGLDMPKLFGLLIFWAGVSVFNLAIMSTYRLYFSYNMPDVEKSYTEHLFKVILQKDVKMHLEKNPEK